ncbi:MAG: methylated-DNA--[protein]-cysteine S-methyltransferase [Candidatus Omnitrophica bacterium]|nr:methylated-DNA--[protein]-cysteine S-methyltransferase [Candidatus Omnitrophota bacterium]MDE2010424.1 methylated-DNA--[protein]-cysteine S-methyltransferase [Candidatus Omnitrophota bacterium]MDE2232299.1 methylated-DNA--[protein]-cysteine S-methyltransferase [Candidatus Omnitrophota bacterium]
MAAIQYKMKTKVGPLYIVASEKGLQGVYWSKELDKSVTALDPSCPAEKIILKAVKQLEEYFQGKRKTFDLNLEFTGTPFQNRVWKALAEIPYGQTVAYKDIAQRINNPKAVRAVGTANGENPFCIIVPCHRVIAADGSIGGYGGGLGVKRRLLEIEQS